MRAEHYGPESSARPARTTSPALYPSDLPNGPARRPGWCDAMRRKHHRGYQGCFTRLASRYRSLFTLVWTFLALLSVPGFNGFAHAQSATYRVTFEGKFTASALASGVSVPSGAHFSTVNRRRTQRPRSPSWSEGGTASAGIESMAEVGGTNALKTDITAAMLQCRRRHRAIHSEISALPPPLTVDFTVTSDSSSGHPDSQWSLPARTGSWASPGCHCSMRRETGWRRTW